MSTDELAARSARSERFTEEIHKSTPSPEVDLFELDLNPLGLDSFLRFHNGTSGLNSEIRFKGQLYTALPIQVSGIELTAGDEPPRPSLSMANIGGFMSALLLQHEDLVGAKLTRRRTLACFLDGQPEAAHIEFAPDIFYVERKVSEDRLIVSFELASATDLDGVKYPLRKVTANYCHAKYRGEGCGFGDTHCVTSVRGDLFNGAARHAGLWAKDISYQAANAGFAADSVLHVDEAGYQGTYTCKATSPIIGDAHQPTNTVSWTKVQRHRSAHHPDVTDYAVNDTVFHRQNGLSTLYLLWRLPTTGLLPSPPDARYWQADVCGKFLSHCKLRWDPRSRGQTLRFNGFPGTANLTALIN